MHSGVTLARRFTLVSSEDFDLERVARWQAKDERLRKAVTAYALNPEDSARVLPAVARVSSVRDPRLARVVASGTDDVDGGPVPYVITDRPSGTVLEGVLARRDLSPRLAGAIVGSLSRALVPLNGRGIHHGAIRASAISVSDAGVPVLSGLGLDAALQDLLRAEPTSPTEKDDAQALTRLFVRCLTGAEPETLEVDDLPSTLTGPARGLCVSLLKGDGPSALSEVVAAFPPDHTALRGFSQSVKALPLRAEVARAELHETVGKPATEIVTLLTLSRAARTVEVAYALRHCAPDLAGDVARGALSSVSAALPPSAPSVDELDSIVPDDERALFDDLEAYEEMVEVQNAEPSRSVWEAILYRLHSRWPQVDVLARMHDEAHTRAGKPGPIPTRALLMTAGVVLVVFAVMTAFSLLAAPVAVDQDRHNPPSHTYPSYTFGPTASPSEE